MKLQKIIYFILIFSIIVNVFNIPSNAIMMNFDGEFEVKQITSENQVKKDSATNYIIVFDYGDGTSYALASEGYGNWDFAMIKENAQQVILKDDGKTIQYDGERSILWNFNKSSKTIDNGDENFVLSSTEQVYWLNPEYVNVRQLEFGDTTNDAQCGIRYRESASDMKMHFMDDGTVKFEQLNSSSNNWLGFYTAENRWTATPSYWAINVKLYEVIEKYSKTNNFKPNIVGNPQYPEVGSVVVNRTKAEDVNYESNGITKVTLTTNAVPIEKDMDFLILYDNSIYTNEALEDTTREKKIEELVEKLSSKILGKNANNRVGIVGFANSIQNETASRQMGFTNDISKVQEYLALEKDNQRPGTDYTRGFYEASNIIENLSCKTSDVSLIFITDAMASIYNRTNCEIYKNTQDGISGNHADNWVNYVLNTNLKQLEYLKLSGVNVFSINTQSSPLALYEDGSFVVTPDDTNALLDILTPNNAFKYDISSSGDEQLDEIFNKISKTLYINPANSKVTDLINADFIIQNKEIGGAIPVITIKEDNQILETITFLNNGNKAISSLMGDTNILSTTNGRIRLDGVYFTYDQNDQKIEWKIDELFMHKYSLEYPVYLMNTSNVYDDGNYRQTGNYDISQSAILEYSNYLNKKISLDFPQVTVNWTTKITTNEIKDNGLSVKTGDKIVYISCGLVLTIITMLIYLIKMRKTNNV